MTARQSLGGGRRVVVTGLGCISPVGNTAASTFAELLRGSSGVGPITHFDASDYDCRIAASVKDFDPAAYVPSRKEARRIDTFAHYAIACAQMALEDASLDLEAIDRDRAGTLIGTGVAGLSVIERQQQILLESGPRRVSPFLIPMFLGNLAAGHLAIRFGLRGPSLHVSTACATGTHAIGDAAHVIARGDADVMLAGSTEAGITPLLMAGFCQAKALSLRNDSPSEASRPFDGERDGFVMGEGAGVLVLESEAHARARGAEILAEVAGYGLSNDAHHITAPEERGSGGLRAMQMALASAGMTPSEVDYINAHGTSTRLGDKAETIAIIDAFGDHATSRALWISSTKSMIGHLLGAAGAVEAIVCVMSIREGAVHPTINQTTPDPDCPLDVVANEARPRTISAAMSNSFGFGGQNASLLLRAYEG